MDFVEYYGLKDNPFKLSPDPGYFFPSSSHEEANSALDYIVQQKEGFCVITGEPGTGKTTLLNLFINRMKDVAEIALVLTPSLTPDDFLQTLLDDLNIKCEKRNKAEMLKALRNFLVEKADEKKVVLIIIDEAQNIPDETLEEFRLLSNLETDREKLLQIILFGQPELKDKLEQKNLRQLNQRITVRANLSPLSPNELNAYINCRLMKAGKGFLELDKKGAKQIYSSSAGIPRLVNLIISRAIMAAYLDRSHVVSTKHVKYALSDIQGNEAKSLSHSPFITYSAFTLIISIIIFTLVRVL